MPEPILSAIDVEQLFAFAGILLATVGAAASFYGALRTGALSSVTIESLGFKATLSSEDVAALDSPESDQPFESRALAKYDNHALTRANISFWFSLIFASIGFGVIIFAFATHTADDIWGTVIKATSGAVIDAVSSLFFVQSTNAQKAMSEFFEKLRLDRLNAEARELLNGIENAERRDQLKAQLVLKYSGIDALVVSGEHP
jgi:xanthine/uracil/vitamin C permease (AzgA family)